MIHFSRHPARSLFRMIFSVSLVSLFWIALTESITMANIMTGVAVAILSLLFTNLVILEKSSYSELFTLPPLAVGAYVCYLLYQIYSAGFSAMRRVITGHVNVRIVDIETTLTDDFLISLLANSITLTPGTVTLDREGGTLKIIWLSDSDECMETRNRMIKGKFEEILSQGEGG